MEERLVRDPMIHLMRHCLIVATAAILLSACADDAGRREGEPLCEQAYALRYSSLDSVERLAQRALAYPAVSDEATCLLAFAHAMRMDYPEAERLYSQVIEGTRSELLRLTAQVGMMRVCQRRGANKDFYDYHSGALASIERLAPDVPLMDGHQVRLWHSALTDLHLQLSIYYYYLRQEVQAKEEFAWFSGRMQLFEGDSAQLALFHYLRGNVRNVDQFLQEDNLMDLHTACRIARERGCAYIEAKAMASILQDESMFDCEPIGERGEELLRAFSRYGSLFDVAQTYLLMGRSWLDIDADSALGNMLLALDQVSEHHRRFHPQDTAFAGLLPFDSVLGEGSVEMQWIHDPQVVCLPELMADVREGLCMAYSALGLKAEADCNRNIYLDILDATRQDRRMEQRLDMLERQERLVGRGILAVACASLVLLGLLAWLVWRVRLRHAQLYAREQAGLERAMAALVARSDASSASLAEYEATLDEARKAAEARLDGYKRQWVDKLTCLSIVHGITPFLDRLLYELRKPSPRVDYIAELADCINLYNDILTHWIKVRQGAVSLRIETFPLQPLLDIVGKSKSLFERRGIRFRLEPTSLQAKADRALTLFMMNTLLDNARKFTGEGGSVSLRVVDGGEWVEIDIEDTGTGLSEEVVRFVNGEKGYAPPHRGGQRGGFGLLNCRGIIEKYRKTSSLFSVCTLGVSSRLGEGSRFFFRLPKGLLLSLVMLLPGVGQAGLQDRRTITDAPSDTVHIASEPTDSLLMRADDYANRAFDANVCGEHEQALVAVDSACQWLNRFYLRSHPGGERLMHLFHEDSMPEISLWSEGFDTDYHIILDIRNEAAIAALALCEWDVYYYNNEVYTRLYKLMAQDSTLEAYCSSLAEATANKRLLLMFLTAVVLLSLLAYYVVYYRMNILTVFNLRQILELGNTLFASPPDAPLADILRQGITPIRRTDGVCLAFPDGRLQFSGGCPAQEYLGHLLRDALEDAGTTPSSRYGGRIRLLPLMADDQAGARRIGVLAVVLHGAPQGKDDERLLSLIARHTATNIYYSSVRTEHLRLAVELKEDERRRAQSEAEGVHVQNQVIDNCLSALKHETMYYPSRIHRIALRLRQGGSPDELASLSELAGYYKEVFTLLASCASQQVEKPLFRRGHIPCEELAAHAGQTAMRLARKRGIAIEWSSQPCGGILIGDPTMLAYLMENLMEVALSQPTTHSGNTPEKREIHLSFEEKENFLTFVLRFSALPIPPEQLRTLFHPETLSYDAMTGSLLGTQFLIAKQIVRLHDDLVRRGCGIREENTPTGPQLEVTLPSMNSTRA